MRPANLDTSLRPDPAAGDAATTATVATRYDPSAPVLLGTFGADRARGAILRLPDGAISKVAVGDKLGAERVLAIAENSITVARKGATRRFTIPGA